MTTTPPSRASAPRTSADAGPRPHASGAPDAMPVSEIFASIQGEGRLAGVPSFFIRLSGCNLRCAWCDTPYASWNPEGDPRSVADLVAKFVASRARHVVITGGEPMIFPQVEPLARALKDAGAHITIETAGTIFRDLPCDLMSISPKLSGSTPRPGDPRDPAGAWRQRHEERRINIEALTGLIERYPQRQLKFVICSQADLDEIDGLLARLPAVAPDDVLLMPEGVAEPPLELRALVAGACIRRNWRYCHRLHITLYGNRRGT